MPATGAGVVVDICPKADSPPPWQAAGESYYRQSQGWGGHLWSHPEWSSAVWLASSWSFQVQLVFSPRRACSISLWSVLGTGAARALGTVWSSLANSSTWGFSICKTTHRIWLRILSVVLEKELNMLHDYIIIIRPPLSVFLCFCISHFSD